jgi:hypothetical protein
MSAWIRLLRMLAGTATSIILEFVSYRLFISATLLSMSLTYSL